MDPRWKTTPATFSSAQIANQTGILLHLLLLNITIKIMIVQSKQAADLQQE